MRLLRRSPSIDVIIPIYGGGEETRRCLKSVARARTAVSHRVIVIDDCGPDADLQTWVRGFAESQQWHWVANQSNLGFTASANRGMAMHRHNDVVLLNSDTAVSDGWLDRFSQHAQKLRDAATMTPFSNNATIASFPKFCHSNRMPEEKEIGQLDALFADQNRGIAIAIPTGVGFCMYITRRALRKIGPFDAETFPVGYGEENDFCRRAAAAGMENYLLCDIYVGHQGGVSFGDKAEALQRRHAARLLARHPDYDDLVHAFIEQDSPAPYRERVLRVMDS